MNSRIARGKLCPVCGNTFVVKASHASIRTHCSRACMAKTYKSQMLGESNPNYRAASDKTCAACGAHYASYSSKSKYCSRACYVHVSIDRLRAMAFAMRKDRPEKPVRIKAVRVERPKKTPVSRERKELACIQCGSHVLTKRKYCSRECMTSAHTPDVKKPNHTCIQCGIQFHAYAAQDRPRKFCSYACHLASGGAHRAGEAAVMAKRRYGNKKDANHKEIVDAFERLGSAVLDLSDMGYGVPDLIVSCKSSWQLVDVKNPKTGYGRRGLNPIQKDWALKWKGGPVYMVSSVDDVISMVNGNYSAVKSFGGFS